MMDRARHLSLRRSRPAPERGQRFAESLMDRPGAAQPTRTAEGRAKRIAQAAIGNRTAGAARTIASAYRRSRPRLACHLDK